MLSSPQGRVGQGQPAILTFEDFEDNEEYDKILTVEELRKKAADFISVLIGLFRKSKTRSKRRRKCGLKRSDRSTVYLIRLITIFH
jgi:hypothetical protein